MTQWGIIDIGTRAVRLMLISAAQPAERRSESALTHLGQYLGPEGLSEEGVERLISALRSCFERFEGPLAERYYAVGTAALRSAQNQPEVLERIEESLGLSVTILSGEEEAYLSLIPVFEHFKPLLEAGAPFLLIDQGGGSTELSVGRAQGTLQLLGGRSLPLGTERLKASFLREPTSSVAESWRRVSAELQEQLCTYEPAALFGSSSALIPRAGFAMGSVITRHTGRPNNRKQHGAVLELAGLERRLSLLQRRYQSEGRSVEEWVATHAGSTLDHELLSLFGLPLYCALSRAHQLDRLQVCGYGLRYGVYYYLRASHYSETLLQSIQLKATLREALTLPRLSGRAEAE